MRGCKREETNEWNNGIERGRKQIEKMYQLKV